MLTLSIKFLTSFDFAQDDDMGRAAESVGMIGAGGWLHGRRFTVVGRRSNARGHRLLITDH